MAEAAEHTGPSENEPPFGAKSIGLVGGVMLLTNNLAGPTISLMPHLAQGAGWLIMILAMVILAFLSFACGLMFLTAMRKMPGNHNFDRRVEFADLLRFYCHPIFSALAMLCYFGYLVLTLMSYIIQTAQVLDYASLDVFGCAYGLELWPTPGAVCGTHLDSSTPFGHAAVLSCAFAAVALVCAPLAMLNLDDNIVLQWVAIVGLCVLAAVWVAFLAREPGFPRRLPAATSSADGWQRLFGVLVFNFALMSALPSWANEKKPEVSVVWSLVLSMGYVVVLYSIIGIVGGLALQNFNDGNLFSKLNESGSTLNRLTVTAYPILQNFTSIPVFSIVIKYNLTRLGWLRPRAAAVTAFLVPWALSIPLYTGKGFESIAVIGGTVFSTVVNLVAPVALYALARRREAAAARGKDADEELADDSSETSSLIEHSDYGSCGSEAGRSAGAAPGEAGPGWCPGLGPGTLESNRSLRASPGATARGG
mmetsp:Transcript_565/g.1777  ORF Transcript_565/g.1777 Transcript_565/m.1777 type:complete len:479 (-) Transcript_565:15-1451(-)